MQQGTHRLVASSECEEGLAALSHGDKIIVERSTAGLRFTDEKNRLVGTLTGRHELTRRIDAGQKVHNAVAWTVRHHSEIPPYGAVNVRVATGDEGEVYVPWTGPERSGPRAYPVGLVGEASYQEAIRLCHEGQSVTLFREAGNPHDERAIVVKSAAGATIGYIPRSHWLQSVVHEEGCGATAIITGLHPGPPTGVVLEVIVNGDPLGQTPYAQPAASSGLGWLKRLIGS